MSFRRMLDRTVTLIPTTTSGKDAHGNDVIVEGDPVVVRAGRAPVEASEDLRFRDQQTTVYRFFLWPTDENGNAYTLTGNDLIVDGETYSVRGKPDYVLRRPTGRVHHVEAVAYLEA